MMNEIELAGCRPTPLAHYLKALAVLRLVAQGPDPAARGRWRNDSFVLHTRLTSEELARFFLNEYQPTPIVAPWNGGSGFYDKDNTVAIASLEATTAERFESYRTTIRQARQVLADMGVVQKVGKDDKPRVLEECRATLGDEALAWLDAAYVLTDDAARYPPLLGTGGNDGRLEFTNNFMQWLMSLFGTDGAPSPMAAPRLALALYDGVSDGLESGSVGQFLPGGAGGANVGQGFDGRSSFNPWDFVFMLEGAVLFGGAGVRRLGAGGQGGTAAFPFTVRQSGVGYGTATGADESASRAEMWLPLWQAPAALAEVTALLAEGRASVGGRAASNGVDFARAVASLGVDRGIGAFQRYGFLVRNGLSYFATPLDRVEVQRSPDAHLLAEPALDRWITRFRSKASDARAPASVQRASRRLDAAIMQLCRQSDAANVRAVFLALGHAQRQLARSLVWSAEPKRALRPVPLLDPQWLLRVDDGSIELRLAAALASLAGPSGSIRTQVEPTRTTGQGDRRRVSWDPEAGREVVWGGGDWVGSMSDVLARRLVLASQRTEGSYADQGALTARVSDVAAFIRGDVDERRLDGLFAACLLVNWPLARGFRWRSPASKDDLAPAFYALLKLCFAEWEVEDRRVTLDPAIHRLASRGRADAALRAAVRRLRGNDLNPALAVTSTSAEVARRSAAALLFPLSSGAVAKLSRRILRPQTLVSNDSSPPSPQLQDPA